MCDFKKFWKHKIDNYVKEIDLLPTEKKQRKDDLNFIDYWIFNVFIQGIILIFFLNFFLGGPFSMEILINALFLLLLFFLIQKLSKKIEKFTFSRYRAEIFYKIILLSFIILLLIWNFLTKEPFIRLLQIISGWILFPILRLYWYIQIFSNSRRSGKKIFVEVKDLAKKYFFFTFTCIILSVILIIDVRGWFLENTLRDLGIRFLIGFFIGSLSYSFLRDGYEIIHDYKF